jgi:hypothetical protein
MEIRYFLRATKILLLVPNFSAIKPLTAWPKLNIKIFFWEKDDNDERRCEHAGHVHADPRHTARQIHEARCHQVTDHIFFFFFHLLSGL